MLLPLWYENDILKVGGTRASGGVVGGKSYCTNRYSGERQVDLEKYVGKLDLMTFEGSHKSCQLCFWSCAQSVTEESAAKWRDSVSCSKS